MSNDDTQSQLKPPTGATQPPTQLVSVESQREFDLFSGRRSERTFLKLYIEARTSGLLAAISDRDWKTLCTLATYMDGDGYCFPSQVELARALGCSRQMANERIKSLSGFRFQGNPIVLVEKDGRTEQGTWSRNGYRILPIANLGIFDNGEQRRTDRRKQTHPKWSRTVSAPTTAAPEPTMSRDLDMVPELTVSSPTVPVQLDTNKNQRINKNQISLSNIRKADTSETAVESPAVALPPRGGEVQPISAILNQRRIASPRRVVQPAASSDPDRAVIVDYLADFSRELSDRAPLKSSATRAYNIYRKSGIPLDTFIEGLYRARSIVKERTGVIHASRPTSPGTGTGTGTSPGHAAPSKHKMAYFFAVLEELLGLREDDQYHGPASASKASV